MNFNYMDGPITGTALITGEVGGGGGELAYLACSVRREMLVQFLFYKFVDLAHI